MDMEQILKEAVEQKASDVFIIAGLPLSFKLNGQIVRQSENAFVPEETRQLISELFRVAKCSTYELFLTTGDEDFSFSVPGVGRFRVNVYKQRGSHSAVIRVVPFELPDGRKLGIGENVLNLYQKSKGLVLVTGPAGSGKSTTLACIIDEINKNRNCHVLTLEDPIEFLHKHNQSIISQREVASDTESYVKALRAALRQAPNVIFIGEMRDLETINIALTAAETGHLVLSTLHTVGAAKTIDRIIDVFPPEQQQQIRIQLSMVLEAVVSQQLIPSMDGANVPAHEVMMVNNAVRTMIRDGKNHQIDSVIHSSLHEGMQSMDYSILDLYKQGKIAKENAVLYALNPEMMQKKTL